MTDRLRNSSHGNECPIMMPTPDLSLSLSFSTHLPHWKSLGVRTWPLPVLFLLARRTLATPPSLSTRLLCRVENWRSKILRVCQRKVVQALTLVKMSTSLQAERRSLQCPLISIIKHCTVQHRRIAVGQVQSLEYMYSGMFDWDTPKNLSSHDTIKVPSYTQKCIQKTRGLSRRHKDVYIIMTGMKC